MRAPSVDWPVIQVVVHGLVGLLLVVVVAMALVQDADTAHRLAVLAVAAVVALVYAAGSNSRIRGSRRRAFGWLALLIVGWLVLVALTAPAVYLAFPLYFLLAHLLPPRAGLVAVGALAVMAAAGFTYHQGWSFAAVLGPVLGALVALATIFAIRAVGRESTSRGVMEERERLAREIHDTLAQGFSSIQLLLGAAERQVPDGDGRDLIVQAREVATTNLAEARRFVRALAPLALAEQSLPVALDGLAATHHASLSVDGTVVDLPPAYDEALLRVAQEALGNARRHAAAETIAVTLGYLDDMVCLDVVDDGSGFDPSFPAAGFGLVSMRTRIEGLGGTFAVESAEGGGTAIAVQLPVPPTRGRRP